jgi:hypothetical protein
MTKSELLDKIKRAEKNPLIDASLKASLLKKYNAQLSELEKSEPKKEVKSSDNEGKVDEWKKAVTQKVKTKEAAEKAKNLLQQNLGKSARNFKIEEKDGEYVISYEFTLTDKLEKSEPKKEAPKAKTDDLSSVRVIANEMAKNAGFKSAKVDDLGNEAYLIEISPSSTKDDSQDGMVLNKYKDGTFEVAEMQAGKGGNFINVFGEYKTLKPALTQLLKGNKQKPVKVIDMRSETEKSEDKKEDKKEPSPKYKVGDILWHDTKHKGEFKKVIIDAVTGFTGDGHRYDVEFVDDEDKRINKFAKSYDDLLSKTKPKSEDKKETKSEETEEERCQKIIRDAKAASKKARESAKKSAKKPEVTKAKERIERTYEIIENKIEKGSLTKAEVAKLIVETKEVLKMLEKALKSL